MTSMYSAIAEVTLYLRHCSLTALRSKICTILNNAMQCLKRYSPMAAIIFLCSTQSVKAEADFNLETIKNSSIGHPSFVHKVNACSFWDYKWASTSSRARSEGKKSLLFSNEEIQQFTAAFMEYYKLNDTDVAKMLEDPTFLAFFNYLENVPRNLLLKNIVICSKAMSSVVEEHEKTSSLTRENSGNLNMRHSRDNCLNAKDYLGCKEYEAKAAEQKRNECGSFKWCQAGEGKDILGLPMITGWKMYSDPSKMVVLYRRPKPQRVNVRGNTNRYINIEGVIRKYESPRAGSPASTTKIGPDTTKCTGYGSTITCTTTPGVSLTTPESAAKPGGIKQTSSNTIIDCKDRTFANHFNGKLSGKWTPIIGKNSEKIASEFCPIISTLELSSFNNYAR